MSNIANSAPVRLVAAIQNYIVLALLVIIPLLVFAQVILRYVLHLPLMGIEEILLFPAIWLYFLGGSMASQARNHIDCWVLVLYIKTEKSLALFRLARMTLSVIFGSWATYWAFWFFSYSLDKWKQSDLLYIPMFLGESAIFIGCALMVFFSVIELIDRVEEYRAAAAKHE